MDFSGHTVDKNPPANAGECEFDPWPVKIPHLVVQLSPRIAIPEPLCRSYWSSWALETVLTNKRSHSKEKPADATREETPLSATGEKPGRGHKEPP